MISIFKKILPLFIINFLRRYKNYLVKKKFAKMNTQEVFKSILSAPFRKFNADEIDPLDSI